MAIILNIETATSVCSVSIGIDGKCIALKETNEGRTHAEYITVFIDEIIKEAKIAYKDLNAVAVSSGPGSYTGLRIGVSTAKGLCYALDKPLISVSTLEAMANGVLHSKIDSIKMQIANENLDIILLCPMIDARRMEVYTSFFNTKLEIIKTVSSDIINEQSYSEILAEKKLFFFGDGAAKCKETLSHQPNAIFLNNILPSAYSMTAIAEEKFQNNVFENLAYFEPLYLKDFNATIAKNHLV